MSRTINNPTPAAALYLQSAPLYLEGIKEPDSYYIQDAISADFS